MNRKEEWTMFLENLLSCAVKEYQSTSEYDNRKLYQDRLDTFFAKNLTVEQKNSVEEILLELGLANGQETEFTYQQGMKDCVWLLQNLGVLA